MFGIVFQFLLLISLCACQKKSIPKATTPVKVDQQTIVDNYVKNKEIPTKTVFKVREILAFDTDGNLFREIQLDKENIYQIDISFRYDEQGRITEEILLGESLRKPLRKYQYRYKENFETIVNRFHLDEKTKQWKAQTAIGSISPDKKKGPKKTKRAGFRFKEKANMTDLENLQDMAAQSKISTKVIHLEQNITVLILYTDYAL